MQKLVVIAVVLVAAIAGACPSKRAETSLAGISLGVSMTEVRRALGTPTRVIDTPVRDVAWRAGEREYSFDRNHLVIKVVEGYYQKPGIRSEHSSGVLGISVQGDYPIDKSIKTGLGLTLGDSVQTVRRLYGQAPQVRQHIQIHWTNGSILDIDLNSEERVTGIDLSRDQE